MKLTHQYKHALFKKINRQHVSDRPVKSRVLSQLGGKFGFSFLGDWVEHWIRKTQRHTGNAHARTEPKFRSACVRTFTVQEQIPETAQVDSRSLSSGLSALIGRLPTCGPTREVEHLFAHFPFSRDWGTRKVIFFAQILSTKLHCQKSAELETVQNC